MKTKASRIILFIAMAFALQTTSCTKAKRNEHKLEKIKHWQIERIDYQKAQAGTNGTNAKIGTEHNIGTMVFNSDGTGSYDYVIDGLHRVGTYTWTVTAHNISFNYAAASTNGAQAATYNIIHQTTTSLIIQGDEAFVDPTGTFALNAMFYLRK